MERKCENCKGYEEFCKKSKFNNCAEICNEYEPIVKTNRQWLESLSDEEFNKFVVVTCNRCIYKPCNHSYANCTKGILAWLQAEHKE